MKTNTSRVVACGLTVAITGGCVDLDVANPNAPSTETVLSTPSTIESLVRGSFIDWWRVETNRFPAVIWQVAADGTSSSWGNYGMQDASSEPRVPFNNFPTYEYSFVNELPWGWGATALSNVYFGFRAASRDTEMEQRMIADLGADGVARLEAFGTLIQALSLSGLATIYDRGYVVTDTLILELVPYSEIWAAALERYDEFVELAQGAEWEIDANWVGCKEDWTPQRAIEVATAYRALYGAAMARNPEERAAADWAAIRADAVAGRTRLVGAFDFGDVCSPFFTGTINPVIQFESWGRADYRWIGPADASGEWEKWIASELHDMIEFAIDTDDRRVTGGAPDIDGKYIQYNGTCPFSRDRGNYHCSWYRDHRFDYIEEEGYTTDWPAVDTAVFDFLIAEADYRSGNVASAMEMVNQYRVESGELPAFTSASGVAPGGARCVPQNPDGSCGDFWTALKYEKQMEAHGYGMSAGHFVDDRGWGDLIDGTFEQMPIPGSELLILGLPYYTFPDQSGDIAADVGGADLTGALLGGSLTDEGIRERLAIVNARREIDREGIHGIVVDGK